MPVVHGRAVAAALGIARMFSFERSVVGSGLGGGGGGISHDAQP